MDKAEDHCARRHREADLPHGANGIRIGKFSMWFGEDKIVMPLPGQARHLTVHLGGCTGTVDLHLTHDGKQDSERYNTLVRIEKDSLDRLLEDFSEPALAALRKAARPLRPGWMERNHLIPVLGMTPEGEELAAVTVKKGGKLEFDLDALTNRAYIPETFEELYSSPEGTRFGVYALLGGSLLSRRGTGVVIGSGIEARLWWSSNRAVFDAQKSLQRHLVELLKRHADVFQLYPWI